MKSLLLSCMCIVFLAACNSSNTPATATATPIPTELPSSTQAQLPTSTYTPTPSPTLAGVKYCVVPNLLNLRSGPGINYSIVAVESQGTCGQVTARNEDATWVYITTGKYTGWASVKYLTGQGDVKNLPTYKALTQTPPAASQTPGTSPTKTP